MKQLTCLFAVIAILSISSSFAQDEQHTALEKFLKEWAAGLHTGDVNIMAGLYKYSNDVIAIQSSGMVRKAIREIRIEYENTFREVTFKKAEFQNLIIRQQGEIAWTSCRLRAETTVWQSNAAWILKIYTSFVLKRIEGRWKIVLEQSTPIAGVPRLRSREQPITGEK